MADLLDIVRELSDQGQRQDFTQPERLTEVPAHAQGSFSDILSALAGGAGDLLTSQTADLPIRVGLPLTGLPFDTEKVIGARDTIRNSVGSGLKAVAQGVVDPFMASFQELTGGVPEAQAQEPGPALSFEESLLSELPNTVPLGPDNSLAGPQTEAESGPGGFLADDINVSDLIRRAAGTEDTPGTGEVITVKGDRFSTSDDKRKSSSRTKHSPISEFRTPAEQLIELEAEQRQGSQRREAALKILAAKPKALSDYYRSALSPNEAAAARIENQFDKAAASIDPSLFSFATGEAEGPSQEQVPPEGGGVSEEGGAGLGTFAAIAAIVAALHPKTRAAGKKALGLGEKTAKTAAKAKAKAPRELKSLVLQSLTEQKQKVPPKLLDSLLAEARKPSQTQQQLVDNLLKIVSK